MAYKLFKEKTKYSLHQAVRMKREDILFLYLIDHDSEVRIRHLHSLENLLLSVRSTCE